MPLIKIEKLGTLCGSGWVTLLMLVHVNNYEKYCKKIWEMLCLQYFHNNYHITSCY